MTGQNMFYTVCLSLPSKLKAWNKCWEDRISTGYVLLKYTKGC